MVPVLLSMNHQVTVPGCGSTDNNNTKQAQVPVLELIIRASPLIWHQHVLGHTATAATITALSEPY